MASGSGFQHPEVTMISLPLESYQDPLTELVDRFQSVVGLQPKPSGKVSIEEMRQWLIPISYLRGCLIGQNRKSMEQEKPANHKDGHVRNVTRKKTKKKDSKGLKVQGGKVTKAKSREVITESFKGWCKERPVINS